MCTVSVVSGRGCDILCGCPQCVRGCVETTYEEADVFHPHLLVGIAVNKCPLKQAPDAVDV